MRNKRGGGEKTGNPQVGRSRDRILQEAGSWIYGGGKVGERSGGRGRGKRVEKGKDPEKKSCTAVGTCGLQPGGGEAGTAGKVARRKVLGVSSTVPDSGVPGASG